MKIIRTILVCTILLACCGNTLRAQTPSNRQMMLSRIHGNSRVEKPGRIDNEHRHVRVEHRQHKHEHRTVRPETRPMDKKERMERRMERRERK